MGNAHVDLKADIEATLERYANRRTLIIGDVNSGKTHLTRTIIQAFCEAGQTSGMVILDLAPDEINGIGGKLAPPTTHRPAYLTCPITPPRLTAENDEQILALARENAATIEPLFQQAGALGKSILVINDASLYLQAGEIDPLTSLINAHPTVVINAYCGEAFAPTPFSRHERRQVDRLAGHCDVVLRMPRQT